MKIDIDSIFYIILSIIILAVSGLGRRKRKQAKQMQTSSLPYPGQPEPSEGYESEFSQDQPPVVDAFSRLEQILTGKPQYGTMEEESLETLEDEEEMIIDEQQKISSNDYLVKKKDHYDLTLEKEDEPGEVPAKGLFGDVNEITRAVIYSEILPRKY